MNQDEFDDSYEDEPRRLTNIEIVEKIMNFSRYGGNVQIFVMFGLETYCADVLKQTPEQIDEKLKGFTSPDIWKGIAAEVRQKIIDYQNR